MSLLEEREKRILRVKPFFSSSASLVATKREKKNSRVNINKFIVKTVIRKMSSVEGDRRRKLNEEFENIFREHERLQQDLNVDQNEPHQSLIKAIDQWEEEAIGKIRKTATHARNDVDKLIKEATEQLQLTLIDTVTEPLRQALEEKNKFTEYHIDRWLGSLSEIRRQLQTMSHEVEFIYKNKIKLIKAKRRYPPRTYDQFLLNYQPFNFEIIHGHLGYSHSEHLISSDRPVTFLSETRYAKGMHYFRFRVQHATDELFFGIISEFERQKLVQSTPTISSIHGWWNVDRRVIRGRKDPHVSALSIHDGDEVIVILNCDAQQILLEYPSMTKINTIQAIDTKRDCPLPWKLLVEIGRPGKCLLQLLDWGLNAHETNPPERRAQRINE